MLEDPFVGLNIRKSTEVDKEEILMDVETMREHIKTAYSMSASWEKKLKEMNDNQIIAVYYSLLKRKKIKGA